MLINKSKLIQIDYAVFVTNLVINSEEFKDKVINRERFEMSNTENQEIYSTLLMFKQSQDRVINIKTYRPFNRWSPALAYYTSVRPHDININSRKLNRSIPSIVGTITHELIHLVDKFHHGSFGHAGNSSHGKSQTAPYSIGNIAKEVANGIIQRARY